MQRVVSVAADDARVGRIVFFLQAGKRQRRVKHGKAVIFWQGMAKGDA